MPRRNLVLATNEIYHLFNRSIAKENIFSFKINLRRSLEIVNYYRFPQKLRFSKFKKLPENIKRDYIIAYEKKIPFVEIYSFSFMPNHYHFLLKQLQNNGIKKFTSNVQNSFAKYYNLKNDRNGTLFESSFKAKRVETDEQLIHISRYIHLNHVTSYIIRPEDLVNYPWTSFPNYVNEDNFSFLNTKFLLSFFKFSKDYLKFVMDQVEYQRELKLIKDLIIE